MNWKLWLHGLAAAAIGGAASALSGALTAPDTFNFTAAGWTKLWHLAVIGSIVPAVLYLKQSPLPAEDAAASSGGTQKLGCIALIALLLTAGTTGCNAKTVAQDIVNWTPTIESTATTVGSVVAGLAPQDALVIAAAVTGFNAAAQLLANQAQTYLNNPDATALQQLQAQALGFQQNVNNALLTALRITNAASQAKVIGAIQGLATALTAVLALISTIKGNTLSPAMLTRPVTTAEVLPLLNRDEMAAEVAAHYGISQREARARMAVATQRLAAAGI